MPYENEAGGGLLADGPLADDEARPSRADRRVANCPIWRCNPSMAAVRGSGEEESPGVGGAVVCGSWAVVVGAAVVVGWMGGMAAEDRAVVGTPVIGPDIADTRLLRPLLLPLRL